MNKTVSKKDLLAQVQNAPASQATTIEQSRAIAEVQGAIVLAQQSPRDLHKAISSMQQSCGITALAERAFFRFPRSGSNVTGASIHLARELARCWGNIDYGVKELNRDDTKGESEMLAFAWDLETNTRSETTFIVPHKRDAKGGAKALVDMRDIYENNANMGARRLREMIFSVIPPWFIEEAKELCNETIRDGGGVPLTKRISNAIAAFEEMGVDKARLEKRFKKASNNWTAHDISQLEIIYKSIKRGEMESHDEFPEEDTSKQTTEALKGQAQKTKQKEQENKAAETPEWPPFETDEPKLNAAKAAASKGNDELAKWFNKNKTHLPEGWVEQYGDDLREMSKQAGEEPQEE